MFDPEQLVQDVIDGSESPFKGFAVLSQEIERLDRCRAELSGVVLAWMGECESIGVETENGQFVITRNGGKLECKSI
jgi:hypothetical protein